MRTGKSRLPKDNLAPALFPFLAVMVCTIGALVFILTIAVTQASQSAQKEIEATRAELQTQKDFLEIAADELHSQRTELQTKIDRAKGNLTHLEDHIFRLKEELLQTQDEMRRILSSDSDLSKTREQKIQAVQQMQLEIEKLEKQLTNAIEKKNTSRPAFSIIPYAGPNGTARRPIYLECTAKGLIIQPEGILLSLDDLKPPHDPGNPLDAALRMLRSKLQALDGSSQAATPYPLLLVRPDGIAAYALARSAMVGWEDQQGYELIDQDMKLTFPSSAPGTKDELNRVLADARSRQKTILASIPRNIAKQLDWSSEPTDLALEHGDGDFSGGSSFNSDDSNFIATGPNDRWVSGNSKTYNNVTESNSWPTLDSAVSVPNFAQMNRSGTPNSDLVINASEEGIQSNSNPYNPATAASPWNGSDSSQSNPNAFQSNQGEETGDLRDSQNGIASTQAGLAPQNVSSMNATSEAINQSSGASSQTAQTRQVTGASTIDSTQSQQTAEDSRGQESASNPTGNQKPNAVVKPASNSPSKQKRTRSSIADEYGEDWAVQRSRLSDTPIHRSISIRVRSDRWLIVDDETRSLIQSDIQLAAGPKAARQQLRTAIEEEVNDWGVAISSGYWVPIIKIYSDPQTEWATQQLLNMLDGSGAKIEIQK